MSGGWLGPGRDHLDAAGEPVPEALATIRIQLSDNIIGEQDREATGRLPQPAGLGESQTEHETALLTLRSKVTGEAILESEFQLVAMGATRRCAQALVFGSSLAQELPVALLGVAFGVGQVAQFGAFVLLS
jgi:hypothetical protein